MCLLDRADSTWVGGGCFLVTASLAPSCCTRFNFSITTTNVKITLTDKILSGRAAYNPRERGPCRIQLIRKQTEPASLASAPLGLLRHHDKIPTGSAHRRYVSPPSHHITVIYTSSFRIMFHCAGL